ncbi:fibronectin type III domain-containing protein [Niastella populi]|uniref:Fibronectin type-III domain-containing protein n=1 Tax=Niastella populi TaxID=550983 RepID=A0A1V9FM09_9BACT|nr:fibronectin type III domain-containing protein [Niastella populi]OQP59389.1 hypothetical protein A4R26_21470 [Niastella populi]
MRQVKAKYKKRESEIPIIIQRIKEKLANNPDFPNPPEALTELIKVEPVFLQALANAEGRDKHMVSIKKDVKENVLNLIQQCADYVTDISKGNRTLILSTGFDVTSESGTRNSLPPSVEILEVKLGQPGEATTSVKNVTGVKAYVHQYTKEQPTLSTEWAGIGSSEGSYTFQGLISDQRYWFRVMVIGTNNERGYSQVVTRVIQ